MDIKEMLEKSKRLNSAVKKEWSVEELKASWLVYKDPSYSVNKFCKLMKMGTVTFKNVMEQIEEYIKENGIDEIDDKHFKKLSEMVSK